MKKSFFDYEAMKAWCKICNNPLAPVELIACLTAKLMIVFQPVAVAYFVNKVNRSIVIKKRAIVAETVAGFANTFSIECSGCKSVGSWGNTLNLSDKVDSDVLKGELQ